MEELKKLKVFYETIGYEPYQEIRMFKGDAVKSVYPSSFEETMKMLEEYKDWNCYMGVNPRSAKGQSEDEVKCRKMMVFDIEAIGKKPSLADEKYKKDLEVAIKFIRKVVLQMCSAKVTFIVSSGRGIHLYFQLVPLENKYQGAYTELYSDIVSRVNKSLKKINLKADPPVKDLPRIFGAPGTMNTKYNEPSAERKIMFYEDTKKDILYHLIDIYNERKKALAKIKAQRKIERKGDPLKKVRRMPEYAMFKNPRELPRNSFVNNRIRFNIRLRLRELGATKPECDIIAKEIQSFGYKYKTMYLPWDRYLDFIFMEVRAQNWCWANFEWCVKANFPFPYFKANKNSKINLDLDLDIDFPEREITTWEEAKQFAVDFNIETKVGKTRFYKKALEKHLENNCSVVLWKFIDDNNLIEYLKYREHVSDVSERDEVWDYLEGKE